MLFRSGFNTTMVMQKSAVTNHGRTRDVWRFREKNSDVRTVTPNAELRSVMTEYLAELVGEPDQPLFPRRHEGSSSRRVARGMLRTLCKRAGLDFTPHQFRHYVVNELMKRGNRLECVSKWLGHKSPMVTYRHYWTDTTVLSTNDTGDDSEEMYAALQEKIEELETLKMLLRQQEEKKTEHDLHFDQSSAV